ncbi:MAG: hypothetical protein R2764_18240 [Bacteroidales bacterium]
MTTELKEIYTKNIESNLLLLRKISNTNRIISLLRLTIFILALIMIYVFADHRNIIALIFTIVLAIAAFIFLIKVHTKTFSAKKKYEALIYINQDELEALSNNFQVFDKGEEFLNPEHPYTFDVDVFGEGSLFQFLNRTATLIGKQRLADLLSTSVTDKEAIIRNQMAIDELSKMINWRQDFQAIGMIHKEKKEDNVRILEWASEPPLFKNPIYKVLIYLIPALTVFMIVLLSMGILSINLFFLYLVIPWGIAGSFAAKVNKRHTMVSKTSEMLLKYSLLLNKIETNNFSSRRLKELQEKLKSQNKSSGKSIKQLYAILSALDNRLNFVSWALFNGLLLWDILQMIRLEQWQANHQNNMHKWFDAIAEVDSLISLSNYHFNNPDTTFPVLHSSDYIIQANELGHPLINKESRVDNDIAIHQKEFFIITGANMAGKSTFLRTLVTNMILGMCGAPVCARQMEFNPIRIFTSIRTNDSLLKNESYFYSELKRLKRIMDELKSGEMLFVVLDEILKGTNSRDKHAGSEALLKQFISLHTSGIVATHDVALGRLAETFPENIRNKCFEVEINGNNLTFDYKLREGISKNMNATILMKEMGITI